MRPPAEAVIQRTQELIKIPSLSGTSKEQILQIKVAKIFHESGIKPVLTSDYVFAKLDGTNSKKLFVLMSHPDVVPANDIALWQHPPFEAHIENDELYGRGTSDMKAGLAAGMEVLLRTKKSNIPPPCDIMFVSTVEEETTGRGAKAATKMLQQEIDQHDEVAIVYTEPSGMTHVYFGHKGNIPATATAEGKTFHTALVNTIPQKFYATGNILAFGNKLLEQNKEWQNKATESSDVPTVATVDLIGNEGSVFNQAAAKAGLTFDIRTTPETHSSVQKIIDQIAASCNVTIKYEVPTEPVTGERTSPLIHVVRDIDPNIKIGLFPAAADMAHVIKGLSPEQRAKTHHAIFGPGFIELAHQRDEMVPLEHILRITELYLETYKRFAAY